MFAIRLVEAIKYLELESKSKTIETFKEIGETNVSLDFSKDKCTDEVLQPTKNGKKKRCCVINHDIIPQEILKEFYEGTFCKNYLWSLILSHTTTVTGGSESIKV